MNSLHRSGFAIVAIALCSLPAILAGQGAGLQRPPRITSTTIVKPTVTPGKFRPATLPMSLGPGKTISESGALIGLAAFDLTEGKITVRSGDYGQYVGHYVGMKVMLSKSSRPVTFEFDIYGAKKADNKIRLQIYEEVRKPDGTFERNTVNMTVVEVYSLRQRLSISGTPSGDGWFWATATPTNSGTNFDLISVTAKQG